MRVVSGKVLIKYPAGKAPPGGQPTKFVPLTGAVNIPIGSQSSTRRKGRIALTSAADTGGKKTQTADFYDGIFQVKQSVPKKKPKKPAALITDLVMKGQIARSQCAPLKGARARRSAKKKKGPKAVLGKLWGNGKGKFRTNGKYSSATVRGTIWLVAGPLRGDADQGQARHRRVRDFKRKKTVTVKAGHSYLARASAPRARHAADARLTDQPRAGAGGAAQRAHRLGAERGVDALGQLGAHEVELLGPDRRRAGHRQHAVALARGLGLGGDDLAHRVGPHALHLGQRRLRREPVGERGDGVRQRSRLAAPHAGDAARAAVDDRAVLDAQAHDVVRRRRPGTCARSVVVTTPGPRRRRSTSRSRRPASSSLMTSSSSSSGGAPRSSSSTARSASSSASSARRCSPCEP